MRVAHTGKALLAYGKLNPGRIWWEADALPEHPELPLGVFLVLQIVLVPALVQSVSRCLKLLTFHVDGAPNSRGK